MEKQQRKVLLSVCAAFAAIAMASGAGIALQTANADASTFEMIYGAGIRVSDPTGIRFKAKMDAAYYNQLKNGTDNAELHVALIPYAMYTAYQADSSKGATALYPWLVAKYTAKGIVDVTIPAEKIYSVTEKGETYYCANGVLSNVYFNNYHLEFVGVAYIQRGTAGNYTYEDVANINEADNARSIFEVACKAAENEEDYAKYKSFLDATIEKGMYRAYGVTCEESVDSEGNKTTESYTYNGTSYATYEDMKTGVGLAMSESTVTIEGETLEIAGGTQEQLNASVLFSNGVEYTKNPYYTWNSSNESIVTVDENGVITAVGVGSATITVSAFGGRFFDSCTVNVTKGGTVNLDYQFYAQGDAGVMALDTGNATIDLTEAGIDGTNVTRVTCGGEEIAIAGKTENSITLTNAPAGMQEYTFETTIANYVLDGCVYGQGISTKDEFIAWQTAAATGASRCYTVLLDNIDLGGVTLAEPTTYYYGTFDGMAHTVSGFTYTKGLVWMMAPATIKNVQFTNATQDCTFAGTAVVQYGFFGQVLRGTVENVKVSMSTINVPAVHRGVIAFAFNNGNTAGAPAVLQNVIFEVTPQADFAHYAYQARASVADLASIDSVYMYFTNGASGGFDIWGGGGPYTNSGFYATEAAMLAAVDFSTWAEPWQVDFSGVPYIGKAIERETIELSGEFMAKGDAGVAVTNTGNATFDLSATGYDFSGAAKVLCNGEAVTLAGKTATSVTVKDAPAGKQVYTIVTPEADYVINGFVYGQGISTKDEFLAWQASAATAGTERCYTVLLNDINLEGATLTNPTEYYRAATFDGMGHTVSNFTYTRGFLWLFANSVIKNVQFTEAVQDCSFAGTTVVQYGFFGNNLRGRVENVKISISTTNVGNVHRAVLVNVLNNGNTADVAGVLQNVVAEVTPQADFEHYVYQAQATEEGLSSIDSVYMYFTNGATGGFDIWGTGGAYTNSGFYATEAALLAAVDFSTWAEPWQVDENGVPYIGKAKEIAPDADKLREMIDGIIDAPTPNNNVKINFTDIIADIETVSSVVCGTMNVGYTVNGKVLTLINAPKGEKTYTIETDSKIYFVNINVYEVEKTAVTVEETFYAKGDGGFAQNAPTGNATVDFSDSAVMLSNVESVTYADGTAATYAVNGNVLTLTNAPGGESTYIITTDTHIYTVSICVYVQGISTAEEFEAYRTHGENWAYTILLNDIDFGGATIAATSNYLRGTFDGLGHTIANCTLQASLFGNLYANSGVIKNLQLINVTQDCSNIVTASVSAVRNGFLVQTAQGTIENVLIKGELINMPEGIAHWGLICYNGTPVIKNVLVNVKSMGSTKKLMAANISGGTLDSVYVVLNDKTLASISNITDLQTATNVGVYATDGIMMASVDFSTWAEPWIIENGKLPYMSDYSEYLGFIHDEYVGTTSYNLIENGTSQYKVLLNGETYETLWAQYIDFRTYLAEATGVTLAWSNDAYASNYNDSAKFISLGKTAALEKSGIAVDYDLLGTQGYQIITLGDDIYIIGENDGLSYAVYDLLNRLVGLEVYTTTRYAIDQVDVVALPDLAITEVPDIEYRTPANGEMAQYDSKTAATRRALRLNQSDSIMAAGGRAHNVTTHIVPYDEWGKTNPNWFSSNGDQLCYTAHGNTDDYNAMVAEAVANIKALLLAEPTKTLFSITQMDTRTWCTCTACSALKTKYGTDAVSQIYFVNDVTDILNEWLLNEQGGREVQFAIFAYYTTKTAPATQNADGSWTAMDETVILNDNVSVWIAPIEDDFRVNINQTNSSNNMRTMVESWSACAGSYFIWSYDTYFNNYMIPYDTYDAIQDMIRFCAEYNTKYFFVNGAWDLTQNTSFGDLKAYLHAKLMWNCNLDVNTLINNFFDDVYKEAGDTMKSVFEAWRAKSATFGGNIYSSSDSWYEIYRSFDNTWLKTQLSALETAISQIAQYQTTDAELYTAIYDSIVAESISLRYLYKERNGTEYSSSAWGKLADDAARLGVNKVSEGVGF